MYREAKEANPKKNYMLYYFNYLTFQKRQNYRDSKMIRVCQGFGVGWVEVEETEHRGFFVRSVKVFRTLL